MKYEFTGQTKSFYSVTDNAVVYGDARIYAYASVYDDAKVSGNARVSGDAVIIDWQYSIYSL